VALVSVGYIYKAFIKRAIVFINKRSLFIKGLSKVTKAGVADDIKGVNRCNLRQRSIIYKLKGLLLLINSLISVSDYFVQLFSWVILYSIYSTNLLFLLKTHTLLY
jgi:hypothetical protein